MKRQVEIRDEFRCAPFFEEMPAILYETEASFEELVGQTYFLFDMEQEHKPWNNIETSIVTVLKAWKEKKAEIGMLFRNRLRKDARQPMIHFAAHLLSILHWLNETPVVNVNKVEEQVEEFHRKPVNFIERYFYIIKQPDHYHSFIQLVQLYEEIEKLYAKTLIIKKRSSSR